MADCHFHFAVLSFVPKRLYRGSVNAEFQNLGSFFDLQSVIRRDSPGKKIIFKFEALPLKFRHLVLLAPIFFHDFKGNPHATDLRRGRKPCHVTDQSLRIAAKTPVEKKEKKDVDMLKRNGWIEMSFTCG
jgi:hypothetical protein